MRHPRDFIKLCPPPLRPASMALTGVLGSSMALHRARLVDLTARAWGLAGGPPRSARWRGLPAGWRCVG